MAYAPPTGHWNCSPLHAETRLRPSHRTLRKARVDCLTYHFAGRPSPHRERVQQELSRLLESPRTPGRHPPLGTPRGTPLERASSPLSTPSTRAASSSTRASSSFTCTINLMLIRGPLPKSPRWRSHVIPGASREDAARRAQDAAASSSARWAATSPTRKEARAMRGRIGPWGRRGCRHAPVLAGACNVADASSRFFVGIWRFPKPRVAGSTPVSRSTDSG